MYISRLSLTNYRNFRSLDLRLPPGLVFIVGDNAQGKSNLLEAAYLLAIAKSYRTNAERELVHWSAQRPVVEPGAAANEQTIVSGEVEQQEGKLRVIVGLRVVSDEGAGGALVQKQARVNGAAVTSANLVGRVNAALFTATDIELIYGPPSGRRRFMDILISQVDRSYLRTLQRYQRVLTHRNHLLRMVRERHSAPEELDFWDAELVKEGSALVIRRTQVIASLTPMVSEAYVSLAGAEELSLTFMPSVAAEQIGETIASQRHTEIAAGITLSGPHRDDIGINIDGMPAGTYASRGQARTVALALRLAEASFLRAERREEPILLLDDVLSELDPERRRRVLKEAAGYQQALVTAADPLLVQDSPVKAAAVFYVQKGEVEEG